ncbi:acyltransferase [Flavobacterium limnophilum]|uniref:acyltransferase n=1 Tax=Flavobacterium limnophilum TaxID=3003262 RepID=UPI00248262E5|nr:acyltransferase [Flavobacterium limnophilum]
MNSNSTYSKDIKARSKLRFIKGLYPRFKNYLINNFIIWIARRKGATIGQCVTMPYKLAKSANSNLTVGNHTSIQSHLIDLRCKVTIGSYVIIGSDVQIITLSHNIDSVDWEHKPYGIEIEDYCWLATRVFVLPSCQLIGYGAVCAAGSVLTRNVDSMAIVTGNPAVLLRKRKNVHTDLCVESMLGNDFVAYINAYKTKFK